MATSDPKLADYRQPHGFCTLALGRQYHLLAEKLVSDLARYAPEKKIVILTDDPSFFKNATNAIVFGHRQKGIQHCYNDKRIAIVKALEYFAAATCIDVDARFTEPLPSLMWPRGISCRSEPLLQHVQNFTPERLPTLNKLSAKIDLDLEAVKWVGEALFTVSLSPPEARSFSRLWGKLGQYLELHGIQSGEGNVIGMVAAKLDIPIESPPAWHKLQSIYAHIDASKQRHLTGYQKFKRRLAYHRRLNWTRLKALKDISFFFF